VSHQFFNATSGPIYIEAEATGPTRTANLKLILDTGATRSLIDLSMVRYLGIDPAHSTRQIQMTTGSATEIVPLVILTRLSALGQHRIGFSVIAHALPQNTGIDGVLGLDFLRHHVLNIDFPAGRIDFA
jgi:predicted aspartyl protease